MGQILRRGGQEITQVLAGSIVARNYEKPIAN